jgi:hypothetical protein
MMVQWANQEDEENDHFPKSNNDKQGNSNNHFDKGQRNNSGNPRKCKLDQEVTAVERNPWGKKSGSNQAQFERVLHKRCPMHPKSQHRLFECVSLRKSLDAPLLPQDRKQKNHCLLNILLRLNQRRYPWCCCCCDCAAPSHHVNSVPSSLICPKWLQEKCSHPQ